MIDSRDAAANEMESRVVSPPEDSPEGATCPEALQEGSGGASTPARPSDCFMLSPSEARPRFKAKGEKKPCSLTLEVNFLYLMCAISLLKGRKERSHARKI